MVWGTRANGSPTTSSQTSSPLTPIAGIKLLRLQAAAITPPRGCSTAAVLSIYDATASLDLVSVTFSNGSQNQDSGTVSVNIPAGHVLMPKFTTAASGCATNPSGVDFVVQYQMQ
jgi:hypothetical protein